MPCECPNGTENPRWHLDNIGYGGVPNTITGAGVRIGHPDTGFTAMRSSISMRRATARASTCRPISMFSTR